MKELDELLKIAGNPLEFFRLCKINDASKLAVVDFIPWPHIVRMTRAFEKERYVIVLKSKQIGISYLLAFYALWKAMTNKAFKCLVLSAGEKESVLLLDKCKFAYQNLPDWIKAVVPAGPNIGKWTETEISFPSLGSSILALPSTETPGIGSTASLVIMDEWDFHKYPESDYATAEAAASNNGQIIGVSTRNPDAPPDSFFVEQFKQARRGENNFYAEFLPWSVRPDRSLEWYETERKNYIGREWYFEKNFPNTEQHALSPLTSRSFFNTNKTIGITLEDLLNGCVAPVETREGIVHIYQKWRNGVTYIAGADVAVGQGGDYQACVILGKSGTSAEVVALIHSNTLSIELYAGMIHDLCAEYKFPHLAVERNAVGIAAINALMSIPYPKLYYEKSDQVGWTTKATTREIYLREMAQAFATGQLITRYKPMVTQMFNFQRSPNGKVEAMGDHDDLVMACCIAYQLCRKAPTTTLFRKKTTQLVVPRRTGGMYGVRTN